MLEAAAKIAEELPVFVRLIRAPGIPVEALEEAIALSGLPVRISDRDRFQADRRLPPRALRLGHRHPGGGAARHAAAGPLPAGELDLPAGPAAGAICPTSAWSTWCWRRKRCPSCSRARRGPRTIARRGGRPAHRPRRGWRRCAPTSAGCARGSASGERARGRRPRWRLGWRRRPTTACAAARSPGEPDEASSSATSAATCPWGVLAAVGDRSVRRRHHLAGGPDRADLQRGSPRRRPGARVAGPGDRRRRRRASPRRRPASRGRSRRRPRRRRRRRLLPEPARRLLRKLDLKDPALTTATRA